jgi:hypothetical protein
MDVVKTHPHEECGHYFGKHKRIIERCSRVLLSHECVFVTTLLGAELVFMCRGQYDEKVVYHIPRLSHR